MNYRLLCDDLDIVDAPKGLERNPQLNVNQLIEEQEKLEDGLQPAYLDGDEESRLANTLSDIRTVVAQRRLELTGEVAELRAALNASGLI